MDWPTAFLVVGLGWAVASMVIAYLYFAFKLLEEK